MGNTNGEKPNTKKTKLNPVQEVKDEIEEFEQPQSGIGRVKSKYIVAIIFNHIDKLKMLNIIKYNKRLQSKMELTIKDYKENAIIEIEIIPDENKFDSVMTNLKKNDQTYLRMYDNLDENPDINNNNTNSKVKVKDKDKINFVKKIKLIIDFHLHLSKISFVIRKILSQ